MPSRPWLLPRERATRPLPLALHIIALRLTRRVIQRLLPPHRVEKAIQPTQNMGQTHGGTPILYIAPDMRPDRARMQGETRQRACMASVTAIKRTTAIEKKPTNKQRPVPSLKRRRAAVTFSDSTLVPWEESL